MRNDYMSSEHMPSGKDWTVCIPEAAGLGFRGVELFASENGTPFETLLPERCERIRQCAEESGICLTAHPWVAWETLPEEELTVRYRMLVRQAERMGIRGINMHLHFLADRREGLPRVIRATKAILPALERSGIRLYYENVPEHGSREPGSELWDFAALFEAFPQDTPVFLNIDTGHAHIMHQVRPLIEEFGDRWAYTHINDNDGLSDRHLAPGDGTCDFSLIAQLAGEVGYSGPWMMEYHQSGLERGIAHLNRTGLG